MKKMHLIFLTLIFIRTILFSQQSENANQVTIDSGYVSVDNGKLFYETAGKGDEIVLLHDGMVHREIWNEQFLLLAENYRVTRYDRRGFGKSTDPSSSYSHIDDLNVVFSQLNIKTAIIFGMSSGGGLAIDFTLKYPEKVRGLVLVGAVVGGLTYTSHMITRGGNLDVNMDFSDNEKVLNYFIMDDPYEIYAANITAKEKIMTLMKANMHSGKADNRSLEERAEREALDFLSEIKIPVLILLGEYDIPDVHAHSGAINAGIKNSRREIIPGCGHLVPVEQPELFNIAVEDFLFELSLLK